VQFKPSLIFVSKEINVLKHWHLDGCGGIVEIVEEGAAESGKERRAKSSTERGENGLSLKITPEFTVNKLGSSCPV
jgi:hypothetical protein